MNSSPLAGWAARLWWKLIRFGFRLLYNELACTYDIVSWAVSLGHWHTWQRTGLAYLDTKQGDCILELAHGTGNLQISRAMGRIAQCKLRRAGVLARLVQGDARRLPFAPASFRAVISTFPTEFIVHRDTLSEVYRVLAPGGRLIIVPVAVFTPTGTATRFLEWLYRVTGQRGPWPRGAGKVMEEIGFKVSLHDEALDISRAVVVVADKPDV